MVTFWLITLVVFILVNRGIWVFTDVSKSMSMFMLEKALGPPIDFVDGKRGSAATTWILQGTLWIIPASLVTFWSGLVMASIDPAALNNVVSERARPRSTTNHCMNILKTSAASVGMLQVALLPPLDAMNSRSRFFKSEYVAPVLSAPVVSSQSMAFSADSLAAAGI